MLVLSLYDLISVIAHPVIYTDHRSVEYLPYDKLEKAVSDGITPADGSRYQTDSISLLTRYCEYVHRVTREGEVISENYEYFWIGVIMDEQGQPSFVSFGPEKRNDKADMGITDDYIQDYSGNVEIRDLKKLSDEYKRKETSESLEEIVSKMNGNDDEENIYSYFHEICSVLTEDFDAQIKVLPINCDISDSKGRELYNTITETTQKPLYKFIVPAVILLVCAAFLLMSYSERIRSCVINALSPVFGRMRRDRSNTIIINSKRDGDHVFAQCPQCQKELRLLYKKGTHGVSCPCCGAFFNIRNR